VRLCLKSLESPNHIDGEYVSWGTNQSRVNRSLPIGAEMFRVRRGRSRPAKLPTQPFEALEPRLAMTTSLSLAGPAGAVYEGDKAMFALTLSEPSRVAERVFVTTAPGTATYGTDYFAPATTQLLFAPGQTKASFSVSVLRDPVARVEGIETFQVIATPANRALGIRSTTVLIDDYLAPPSISVRDAALIEGNEGTTTATFQITLSAATNRPVTVAYATRDGSARVADNDYTASSGSLTFAPGEVSKSVGINISGDRKLEPDETFSLVLNPPAYGNIKRAVGTATIRNDETDQPGFQITVNYVGTVRKSIRDACVWAAQRWAQVITGDLPGVADPTLGFVDDIRIDVREGLLGGAPNGPGGALANAGPLQYRTDAAGLPWLAAAGIDPFDANDSQLRNIVLHEFGHALGFGIMWLEKGLAQGIGTTSPTYVGPNALREYTRIFNTSASAIPIENQGSTNDGSYGVHWQEALMTKELMTSASESSGTAMPLSRITVGAMADLGYEVRYLGADSYQPDAPVPPPLPPVPPVTVPSWSVQDFSVVEGDSGLKTASFNVTLTLPENYRSSGPIEVTYSFEDGSATAGQFLPNDYLRVQPSPIRVSLNGPPSRQVSVPVTGLLIFGDTIPEPDETLFVVLANPTNGSAILTSRATVTIINNDPAGAALTPKAGKPSLPTPSGTPMTSQPISKIPYVRPRPVVRSTIYTAFASSVLASPPSQPFGRNVYFAPARPEGPSKATSSVSASKAAEITPAPASITSQPLSAEHITKVPAVISPRLPKANATTRPSAFASLVGR
jgi:hypothetical protein